MARPGRRILLDSADPADRVRCLSDRVDARALAGGRNPVVTITRMGSFYDPRYGDFEITRSMLESMVRNFDAGVYGQRVALDVAHRPNDGAAGYFTRLFLEGNKLRGEVELTDLGRDAIQKRGMIYVSAEFVENFIDNETRREHGPTLLGAGLVVRPAIKRLDPIELSEESLGAVRTCVTERVTRFLLQEIEPMWEKLKKELAEQLGSLKLAEAIVRQLVAAFLDAGKTLGEDEKAARALMARFVETGKQLAELKPAGDQPVQLSVNVPQHDPADLDKLVAKALAEAEQKRADERKKLTEQRDALVKVFTDTLGELKGLTEEQAKQFREASELIVPGMTEDQVKKLAEHQKAQAEQLAASRQLADLGFGSPAGSVRISTDERNTALQLQEQLLTGLRSSYVASSGRLRLQEKVSPFVERVLTEFDRINAHRIHREHKQLAGGEVGTSDTQLPIGFQRTVIREALSDLRVLDLVQTLTDFQATSTTEIPYEERDISEVSDGVVFERGAIPRAGIAQKMDTAYVLPMKLAYLLTNEVIHFSRASQINWDAWARNVESNARVIRELLCRRIINMLVRESDSYLAATVTDESIAAQLDGATSTIKTAQFPIVRPFQQYNLRGETVGAARNPISITVDGTAVSAYDGSGQQPAGTYYRISSTNLGYIQLVDETGTPVTPAATTATITYDRVTNVAKFDLDVPDGVAREKHLNGLVQAIGRQKAVLDQDRYSTPDYLLMAATVHNDITDAEQFARESKRDGTDTNAMGDLERVKALPAWSTNAPGNDMAEERILMGQRGGLSYVVAKPWAVGEPFEHINSDGRPTGQKQAYGEEYSALKVPEPLRARMSSILVYSATGR